MEALRRSRADLGYIAGPVQGRLSATQFMTPPNRQQAANDPWPSGASSSDGPFADGLAARNTVTSALRDGSDAAWDSARNDVAESMSWLTETLANGSPEELSALQRLSMSPVGDVVIGAGLTNAALLKDATGIDIAPVSTSGRDDADKRDAEKRAASIESSLRQLGDAISGALRKVWSLVTTILENLGTVATLAVVGGILVIVIGGAVYFKLNLAAVGLA